MISEIHSSQPILLGSVLVLSQMGSLLEEIEVLLELLIISHIALENSGNMINKITDKNLEDSLKKLQHVIKFSEGMSDNMVDSSIRQYLNQMSEPHLFAYTVSTMKTAGFYSKIREQDKYLIFVGLNIVNSIALADKLT